MATTETNTDYLDTRTRGSVEGDFTDSSSSDFTSKSSNRRTSDIGVFNRMMRKPFKKELDMVDKSVKQVTASADDTLKTVRKTITELKELASSKINSIDTDKVGHLVDNLDASMKVVSELIENLKWNDPQDYSATFQRITGLNPDDIKRAAGKSINDILANTVSSFIESIGGYKTVIIIIVIIFLDYYYNGGSYKLWIAGALSAFVLATHKTDIIESFCSVLYYVSGYTDDYSRETRGSSDYVFEYEYDYDKEEDAGVTLCTLFFSAVFANNVWNSDFNLKSFSTYIADFCRSISHCSKGASIIAVKFMELFRFIYNEFMSKVLGFDGKLCKVTGHVEYDSFMKAAGKLLDSYDEGDLLMTNDNFMKVKCLSEKCAELTSSLKHTPVTRGMVINLQNISRELSNVKKAFANSQFRDEGLRQEAVGVLFKGGPGTGKSICLEYLYNALCAHYLNDAEFEQFNGNTNLYVFNRQAENEYWDGYGAKKLVTYFDDFGQARDVEGNPDNEWMNVIRCINSFQYNLHMADITKKSNTVFASKFVLVTTNLDQMSPKSIISAEALMRRFALTYYVIPHPHFVSDDTRNKDIMSQRIDPAKLPKTLKEVNGKFVSVTDFTPDAQLFVPYDYKTGAKGTPITFQQMLTNVIAEHDKRFHWHQQHTENLMRLRKNYREQLKVKNDEIQMGELQGYQPAFPSEWLPKTETIKISDHVSPTAALFNKVYANQLHDYTSGRFDILEAFIADVTLLVHSVGVSNDVRSPVEWWASLTANSKFCDLLKSKDELLVTFGLTDIAASRYAHVDFDQVVRRVWLVNALPSDVKHVFSHKEAVNLFTRRKWEMSVPIRVSKQGSFHMLTEFVEEWEPIEEASRSKNVLSYVRSLGQYLWPQDDDTDKSSVILQWMTVGLGSAAVILTAVGLYQFVSSFFIKYKRESEPFSGDFQSTDKFKNYQHNKSLIAKQQKPAIPKYEFGSDLDPNGNALVDKIIDGNFYRLTMKKTGKDHWSAIGYATFIVGRKCLIPYHFIDAFYRDIQEGKGNQMVRFSQESKAERCEKIIFECSIEDILYKYLNKSCVEHPYDVCLLDMPEVFKRHKDITTNFMKFSDFDTSQTMNIRMDRYDKRTGYHNKSYCSGAHFEYEAVMSLEGDTLVRTPLIIAYSMPTSDGDCGALVSIVDPRTRGQKILGYHFAAFKQQRIGLTQMICQEFFDFLLNDKPIPVVDLTEVIGRLPRYEAVFNEAPVSEEPKTSIQRDILPEEPAEGEMGDGDIDSDPPPISTVAMLNSHPGFKVLDANPKYIPTAPSCTKIIPSPLYEKWGAALKAPARLRPFRTPEGIVDPGRKALEGFCRNKIEINPIKLRQSVCEYFDFVYANSNIDVQRRVFSFEEAAAGLPFDSDFCCIDRSTSSGYPWNCILHPLRGKKRFFGSSDDFEFDSKDCKELRQLCMDMIAKLKLGERVPQVFTDSLKDELRPKDKVRSGKTRLFSAGNVALLIVSRMLFGAFQLFYVKNKIHNGGTLGMNPYSDDWHYLATQLLSMPDSNGTSYIGAGDYSGYDKSEVPLPHEMIVEEINKFYDDDYCLARKTLIQELTHSVHIFRGVIYQWRGGMPSGHPLTSLMNCIYNHVSFRMCWKKMLSDHEDLVDLGDFAFDNHVKLYVHGDDNVFAVSPKYSTLFTPEFISKAMMDTMGLDYTSETKQRDNTEWRNITQVEFLKRSFRFDEELRQFVAPWRFSELMECLYWTKDNAQRIQIVHDKMELVLRELSLHGREVFERYSHVVCKNYYTYMRRYGLVQVDRNYESNRDKTVGQPFFLY